MEVGEGEFSKHCFCTKWLLVQQGLLGELFMFSVGGVEKQ